MEKGDSSRGGSGVMVSETMCLAGGREMQEEDGLGYICRYTYTYSIVYVCALFLPFVERR